MKRGVLLITLSFLVMTTTPALAGTLTPKANHLRAKVVKKFGKRAAGRDIIRYGMRDGSKPSNAVKAKYVRTLRAMLVVPPAPVAVAPVAVGTSYTPSYTPSPSYSGGGGCSGMSAESGSLGYNNNTHRGYVGCYQISEDHFNGGSCSGLGTDPSGQDACAGIICRTEGAGAWHNAAGQNPCGRLGG